MYETIVTVVGNVVDTPTRRVLDNGTSVVGFRVASTSRRFDREAGAWGDGDSLYLKVTCWRQLADNASRSLVKGDPVVVTGRLFTRTYEAEGQRRSSFEVDAFAVGHDLARGIASFSRPQRPAPTYQVGDAASGPDGGGEEGDDLPVGDDALAPASGGSFGRVA